MRTAVCCFVFFLLVLAAFGRAQVIGEKDAPTATVNAAAGVNLIRYAGVLRDHDGQRTTAAELTFSLYADQEGTMILWSEVQNVRLDRQGRYTVLLGAQNPLPTDIFAADAARWLGARQADGRETRTLLVSVPYALKAAFSTQAASADTLGGVPAANFVTRNELQNGMVVLAGNIVPLAANGTAGKIPMFTTTDATNASIGNSVMTQLGGGAIDCTDASPCIGIGTSTPLRSLHIKGTDGALVFDAGNAASNPVLFFAHDNFASKFRNRIMLDRTNESMQIWTASVPRVTVRGTGDTMEVAGVIKTTGGIRFPDNSLLTSAASAGGDITQVNAGAGLSGGGATGAVSLSVMSCPSGQILKSTGTNAWGCNTDATGISGSPTFSGTTNAANSTIVLAQQLGSMATEPNTTTLPPAAVRGEANANLNFAVGLLGRASSGLGYGVVGLNTSVTNEATAVAGFSPNSTVGTGVYGDAGSQTGFTTGVWGVAQSPDGAGVYGENYATTGDAAGVWGYSASSAGTGGYFEADATSGFTSGIWAVINSAGGAAAYLVDLTGSGDLILGANAGANVFRVASNGQVFASLYNTGGADFAESFDVGGALAEYEPGDVLAIDVEGYRRVIKSSAPYSTLVAGIYSTKPGILAHLPTAEVEKQVPMAVIGVVPCKVTTENGPIKPGDLLVTSSRAGYAMKGTDAARMQGAIVGKALQALSTGDGLIEVLVTLQ